LVLDEIEKVIPLDQQQTNYLEIFINKVHLIETIGYRLQNDT